MKASEFLKLNWADIIKAAVLAGIMVGVDSLYTVLDSGALPNAAELKVAGIFTLKATIAYLIKQMITNGNGDLAKKEEIK